MIHLLLLHDKYTTIIGVIMRGGEYIEVCTKKSGIC